MKTYEKIFQELEVVPINTPQACIEAALFWLDNWENTGVERFVPVRQMLKNAMKMI